MSAFPPLERKPESIEEAAERFGKAFVRVWDPETIRKNPDGDRPGANRANVFDMHSGLRLIVSRDRHEGRTVCHVSASWHCDSPTIPTDYSSAVRRITSTLKALCPGVEWRQAATKLVGRIIHLALDAPYCDELWKRYL